MRITAELLQQGAEQRTNTLQERELVLRGYGIVVLENLSAMAATTTTTGGAGAIATDRVVTTTTTTTTMNAGYDALDLSNNRITELGNFPRLPRVTALYCSHNQIGANQLDANNKNNNKNNNNKPSSSLLYLSSSSSSSTSSCIFTNNIQCNLPNLTTLTLCFNRIASLTIVSQLAQACPNLVFLSLRGNPVTYKTHYRWFTLHEFDQNNKKNKNNNTQGPQNSVGTTPSTSKNNPFQLQSQQQQVVDQLLLLRVLDYRRIRSMEWKQARKWSQSSTGATILAEFSLTTTTQEEDNNNNNNRNGTNSQTFVPGELLPNDDNDDDDKKKKNNADATIVQTLTNEQKDILRQLLQNAQNENEIQTIQHAILHQGMLPETYYQWQKQQQQEQQEQEQQQATPLQEQSLRTTTTTTTMTTTLSGTKRKVPEDQ